MYYIPSFREPAGPSIRFDSIRFVGTNLQLLQPGNLVCLRKTINNAVVFVRIKWNNKHTFPASKNCDDDTNHKSQTAFVGRTTLPRLADTKKSQPRRTVSTTAVTIATRNPIRTASWYCRDDENGFLTDETATRLLSALRLRKPVEAWFFFFHHDEQILYSNRRWFWNFLTRMQRSSRRYFEEGGGPSMSASSIGGHYERNYSLHLLLRYHHRHYHSIKKPTYELQN